MKKALVLSGGAIKGAYQAGAIYALLKNKQTFEYISGTSVGALNGAFITQRAGMSMQNKGTIDWLWIADELQRFWFDNITKPSDIAYKRSRLSIAWHFITGGKFYGLTDTTPLDTLIENNITEIDLFNSPIEFACCSVNLNTSQVMYHNNRSPLHKPFIIQAIKGSKSIPFAMQPIAVNHQMHVDGGIRDVEPLKPAIKDFKADYIMAITCHARQLNTIENQNDFSRFSDFAERIMDTVINETLFNDIEYADLISMVVTHCKNHNIPLPHLLQNKVALNKIDLICPKEIIDVDVNNFNSIDIKNMFNDGIRDGQDYINQQPKNILTAFEMQLGNVRE